MNGTQQYKTGRRGAALIMAILLLGIFAVMGTAWLTYMVQENIDTDETIRQTRARQAATGGIEAAIAAIEQALAEESVNELIGNPSEFGVAIYDYNGEGLAVREDQGGTAKVTLADECARININHAPPKVLAALLGVDRQTARRIRSRLPRPDQTAVLSEGESSKAWFTSLDDLRTHGLLGETEFDLVNKNWVTAHSVFDHANPGGSLNVNTAPAAVLAAALDLNADEAAAVVSARPFTSIDHLAQVAGKPADAFNVPAEYLALTSRVFRITSAGSIQREGKKPVATAHATAVVAFPAEGAPRVMYWKEVASAID